MSEYSELIEVLRSCDDQSQGDLRILSLSLRDELSVLDRFNIEYEDQAEGISIDLTSQPMKIYKNKNSLVKYVSEKDLSSDIIVVEADLDRPECQNVEFDAGTQTRSCSCVFENLEYFFKFKRLFLENDIASYYDEAFNRLIFLSDKHGRWHVESNKFWHKEYYDCDNDIKNQYEKLVDKIKQNSEFGGFFKESFIEYAKGIQDEKLIFINSLKDMRLIVESASRNFELYKHNFSFSEFKKELDEDKEKYLKEYQSNLSDFLGKISSMPIQFGVYIYLIVRFGDSLVPIIATTILIIVWSIFKIITVNRIQDNVAYLKSKFEKDINKLVQKSGLDEAEVEADRSMVVSRFDKSISLICWYRAFVVVFTVCSLVICFQFIYKDTHPDEPNKNFSETTQEKSNGVQSVQQVPDNQKPDAKVIKDKEIKTIDQKKQ